MEIRSVYMTLLYRSDKGTGAVLHEIQISKDGKSLIKSTEKKPTRPDRRLFVETQLPNVPFIRCERIGSKLYIFGGRHYYPAYAVTTVACVFDAKSSGEVVEFHYLPAINYTYPNIIAAHGRLYHLATTDERSGVPMPFEVYDPSTKSWDPLPPVPQCPFVPCGNARREYMGYAVWSTCILVSLGYLGVNLRSMAFVPLLFNVESGTWHQVDADQVGHCFPWHDKAVVVGDTMYAFGFETGSIILFSINKSGLEEDGTLIYSLKRPYILSGLNVIPHPNIPPHERRNQRLTPLGDLEFCLVQTVIPGYDPQPFWITTFKIIPDEGPFSKIQTLHSTLLFMDTRGYDRFWPMFCYNPDYEPKEVDVMLTATKDIRKESNLTQGSSQEVFSESLDRAKLWSLSNIKRETSEIENSPDMVVNLGFQQETTVIDYFPDKIDLNSCDFVESKESDFVESKESGFDIFCPDMLDSNSWHVASKVSDNEIFFPGKVDSNSWGFESKERATNRTKARRLKRKAKRSKRKMIKLLSAPYVARFGGGFSAVALPALRSLGRLVLQGSKTDYCIVYLCLFIGLLYGLFLYPDIWEPLFLWIVTGPAKA